MKYLGNNQFEEAPKGTRQPVEQPEERLVEQPDEIETLHLQDQDHGLIMEIIGIVGIPGLADINK